MTRHPAAPFRNWLQLARRMVARGASRLPVNVADQARAAGRDTHQAYGRLGDVLPILKPERHWRRRTDLESTGDSKALLLAGLLGCTTVCVHIRRSGPQPAYARLGPRRVDCGRCVRTAYRSATADDECDLCGAAEVLTFWPFAVQTCPLLPAGGVCGGCAEVLEIRMEAAS